MEVLSSSSPLALHSCRLFSSSSAHRFDSSPVASLAASSFFTSSSSFFGVSISNRTLHRFSTGPANFRRLPPRKRRRFTPITAVFERFTERAIRAIIFSQKEAKSLGRDMVFTQHLLLGLIAEDRDPRGFLGCGITIDKAREAVWSIWNDEVSDSNSSKQQELSSTSYSKSTDMPFSISTKRVFEAAVEYSRTMGCQFIAPEHIAIGLFTVDDGSAGRVLKRYNSHSCH